MTPPTARPSPEGRTPLQLAVVTVIALAVFNAGCASTTINKVVSDPSRYRNRQVTVKGTVAETFSVLGRGAYRLEDQTGQLWIVSEQSTPPKGARVTAKGTIREGVNLGTLNDLLKLPVVPGLVLVESSRDARD